MAFSSPKLPDPPPPPPKIDDPSIVAARRAERVAARRRRGRAASILTSGTGDTSEANIERPTLGATLAAAIKRKLGS